MELVLEACEAIIATGDLELMGRYFQSVVLYELYADAPDEELMLDRTGAMAYRVQAKHSDDGIKAYTEKCIKNWKNKTGKEWPPLR